jgi:hypothetical protein
MDKVLSVRRILKEIRIMSHESSFLTITVDKSHIITIGERLYEQSIELIRELVNNGYDADATRVEVTVTDKEITVADNGEGMDREAHILNIARLITQEISLMKDPENPREAYNRQSKLLRDAFQEGDEKPARPKRNTT